MKDGVGDCVVNDIAVEMEHEHTRFDGWLCHKNSTPVDGVH